jgi:hypothetical protein
MHRIRRCLLGLAGMAMLALTACHGAPEHRIEGQTLTVGCAHCIFHMEGVQGCPWAAEVDGKHYFLLGAVPPDHDSHAAGGVCTMPRKAVVDGVIHEDRLIATRVELLPLDAHARNLSAAPAPHVHPQ